MTPRFTLAASDDSFLATAARRYVHTVDISRDPHDVWDMLTADDALVSWSAVITASKWLSPRPFGVGTTRLVTLGGVVRLEERFYRWEEGERMTFTVDAASIPGLKRFAEDLVLQPTPGGTRLTWTFALEGNPLLQPLLGVASPVNNIVTRTIAQGITGKAQQEARR
ncbi:SRPBCC family protein [Nocardia sp. CA2R105]|uniref:SRPBCC family protein n=1 Tax=Nocardia coffeae TaxID=2873381 RepID=UPI001CA6D60D|nr:SRPBCC family protein [Nocardia coffeae]MBY8855473.1 SRPBCC family protein [Nocardia coffeae]